MMKVRRADNEGDYLSHAVIEDEGAKYLVEFAGVTEQGDQVYELIDNDTVCTPEFRYKGPDTVQVSVNDLEYMESGEAMAEHIYNQFNRGSGPEVVDVDESLGQGTGESVEDILDEQGQKLEVLDNSLE